MAEEWPEWLPELGCPVDSNSDDSIEVEVFPDRPDLLSHETIARASRSFLSTSEVTDFGRFVWQIIFTFGDYFKIIELIPMKNWEALCKN